MSKKPVSINQIYAELQLNEQQLLILHLNHYRNLALNLYEWEGLPNGMTSRHIEKALLMTGQAFFYDHSELGFICLPCHSTGHLNVYGEPTQVMIEGHGFTDTQLTSTGILIYNNPCQQPTNQILMYYCKKLAQIDSTMNTNLIQQKVPFIFATSKANEFSIKALYSKMYSGEPAIFVDKDLVKGGELDIQTIACDAPYLLDKLQQHRFEIEKELLTVLGINSTIEKKERLIVDETNANNELIQLNIEVGLRERELACARLNQTYGLQIQVKPKNINLAKGGLTDELDD